MTATFLGEPGRRMGNWQYDRGWGWRLDGADVLLDFDRGHGSYAVQEGPRAHQPIDRYLDAAMAWVEEHLPEYNGREGNRG